MEFIPHHAPSQPTALKCLTSLNARIDLSVQDKQQLMNLRRGFEGEWIFYELLKGQLNSQCIPLYSLLFEYHETEFQIDNLLLYQDTILLNEVKNFEGDFFIRDDKWYAVSSRKEIRNPLFQLQRSEYLLRQLLKQMGLHLQVNANLVFVNPAFTLYQAPYDQRMIFPTQLERFVKGLHPKANHLTERQQKIAEQLVAKHLETSANERLPVYKYEALQKGIICEDCDGFMVELNDVNLQCMACHKIENTEAAIWRSVQEFRFLFPERKITISEIYDWCKIIHSKKPIRRILKKHLRLVQNGRYTYYK